MSKSFKIIISIIILSVIIFFGFFYGNLFSKSYEFKEKIRKTICDTTKGEWVSDGCGLSRCTHECLYKYSDAGKICHNSSQCHGDCVVFSPKIKFTWSEVTPDELKDCQKVQPEKNNFKCNDMKIIAKCEEMPIRCFDHLYRYEDGDLFLKSRDCPAG